MFPSLDLTRPSALTHTAQTYPTLSWGLSRCSGIFMTWIWKACVAVEMAPFANASCFGYAIEAHWHGVCCPRS